MAADFYRQRSVSEVELIRASGYRECRHAITVAEIYACLGQHPGWEQAWMMLSEDQRLYEGWYVVRAEDGSCRVGYHPEGPKTEFDDCTLACAEFVKRHADDLADWTFTGMIRRTGSWLVRDAKNELRRRREGQRGD